MVAQQKSIDEFKKMIYSFFRNHDDVDAQEMRKLLQGMFIQFTGEHSSFVTTDSVITDDVKKEFREMWEGMVQNVIDFTNRHPEIKEIIKKDKKEITEKWNAGVEPMDDGRPVFEPDVIISFSADGLEESIEAGKWTPDTDSFISFRVGTKPIIEMC